MTSTVIPRTVSTRKLIRPKGLWPDNRHTLMINVLADGKFVRVRALRSTYALVICQAGKNNWTSVMLVSGRVLAGGFRTEREAHAFNELVAQRRDLDVGNPSLDKFYEIAGGVEKARASIAELKHETEKLKYDRRAKTIQS